MMFNFETAITEWREQMRAAGIKTAVPLEELELHLREDIDRLMQSGLNVEKAFEISVRQLGQPQALKTEFRKNGTVTGKISGVLVMAACVVMILRVLYVHYHTVPAWKHDQIGWILFSISMFFWAANSVFFNFTLGDVREVRLWKLVGITYSVAAIWLTLQPILFFLTIPKYGAALNTMERVLIFGAATICILSVFGWQLSRKFLPVIRNRRTRTFIGVACALSGSCAIAVFIGFGLPHFFGMPTPLVFVIWSWTWTATAVLAGTGYGLAEAARSRDTTATA